jgi:hypothetical protein
MSQILDALRELDRKKSSLRGRETNISGKFRISDTPRRKKRTHLYLVAVLLTPVAAAAITYAIIAKPAFLTRSSIPVIVSPTAPFQKDAPTPRSREPANRSGDEIREIPPKSPNHPEIKTTAATSGERKESPKVSPKKANGSPRLDKKTGEKASAGFASALPPLKISAILWYEDPSKRRAVINGIFNIEGSITEGIKVLEINPTSVRFSHQGRVFEISALE